MTEDKPEQSVDLAGRSTLDRLLQAELPEPLVPECLFEIEAYFGRTLIGRAAVESAEAHPSGVSMTHPNEPQRSLLRRMCPEPVFTAADRYFLQVCRSLLRGNGRVIRADQPGQILFGGICEGDIQDGWMRQSTGISGTQYSRLL